MVRRRPPAVSPPDSDEAVLREARVLDGTAVPHPHCHGRCEDEGAERIIRLHGAS